MSSLLLPLLLLTLFGAVSSPSSVAYAQTRVPVAPQGVVPSPPPASSSQGFLPQFNSLWGGATASRAVPAESTPSLSKSVPVAPVAAATRASNASVTSAAQREPPGKPAVVTAAMQAALQSTVRLRVEDGQGQSVATGTIIDTHGHEALVITCGHVFRESRGQGRILVELFTPGAGPAVTGKLLDYDLARDIGLLCIPIAGVVPVSRVGTASQSVEATQPVFSVGCDHGERPRVMASEIVGINQFIGPPNYTATHAPCEGRSGGGLFTAEGVLIGVCNAADPTDDRGLFAALPTIHWQLDQVGQSRVYGGPRPVATDRDLADRAVAENAETSLESAEAVRAEGAASADGAELDPRTVSDDADPARVDPARVDPARVDPARVLADMHVGAEAIVLLRSPGDPSGALKVVPIDRLPADLRMRLTASPVTSPPQPAPPSYAGNSYRSPTAAYPSASYPVPANPANGSAAQPMAAYPANSYPPGWYPPAGYPAAGYPAAGYPAAGYPPAVYPYAVGPAVPVQRAQSPRRSLFGG